jgi:NAD(P)H dehydrogenase (quinone)
MRLMLVHAHPNPDSLTAAARDAVLAGAARRGAKVRLVDLAAEGFDPRLTEAEHRAYASAEPAPDLRAHLENLRWADTLIFTAPVWWGHMPALLSGWAARVLRPGLGFEVRTGGRLHPLLENVTKIGLVTSTGAPEIYWRVWRRSPERGFVTAIAPCFHPRARRLHWVLHGVDAKTPAQRARWLEHVSKCIETA